MRELCSVCLLESLSKLTPLFTKNGNHWQSTGLSEMLETVLEEKILKGHESILAICTRCIYKISKLFHDNYSMLVKNIPNFCADKISSSDPDTENEKKGKIRLADELKWEKFKQTYCVIVDGEEANQRKELITTDGFKEQENRDFINCIPLECLAEIFTYLSLTERLEVEKVCQRWKDASEIAWRSINEIDFGGRFYWICEENSLEEVAEEVLSRCGQFLEKVKIDCDGDFDPRFLLTVNLYCQNLKKIVVQTPGYIREDDFSNAFFGMKVLQEIHLSFLNFDDKPLDFLPIFNSLTPTVEKIKLKYWNEDHDWPETTPLHDYFPFAIMRFNALKCLSLTGLELKRNVIQAISTKITLVELKLNYCDFPANAQLTQDFPNLEKLKYVHNEDFYSVNLLSFINHCRNLKKLTVIHHMSDDIFKGLGNLKQLEHFSLEYLSSSKINVIEILAESCPDLKHLELNNDYREVGDVGFQSVANLKNLEHLALRGMKKINDDHLMSIAMKCQKLRYLSLCNCTGISNSGLQKLGNLINLEYLKIEKSKDIDDSVIFIITSNCMKLKGLKLSYLDNISDFALETLAQLKELQTLDIDLTNKINDNVISIIVSNCKKLRKFNYPKLS